MFRKILIFMVVVALLGGCASEEKDKGAGDLDEGPLLVATTTIIADIARNLSGERMRVVSIMRPGEDPHIYDPRPNAWSTPTSWPTRSTCLLAPPRWTLTARKYHARKRRKSGPDTV